ncbi:conserved protein, unknown function [Hepatocystis sp. ex Piliocolobus tephrosceles]|nr:conserved protein, unknown function [Hepatocystis sp. ex Piliocolobus tephrosceles]
MKIGKNEISKVFDFGISNKQSLLNLFKLVNTEYKCGALYNNLILNPDKKHTFLYYEIRKNEVIFGFKDTTNKLYQNLLKTKDCHIFGEEQSQHNKNISHLIKDIKNYSYIQGGVNITFHKNLLSDFLRLQIEKFKDLEDK